MRAVSRCSLLARRRPEEVKADAVTCDAGEKPAFREGAIDSAVLTWLVSVRIDCLPLRPPQRIDPPRECKINSQI